MKHIQAENCTAVWWIFTHHLEHKIETNTQKKSHFLIHPFFPLPQRSILSWHLKPYNSFACFLNLIKLNHVVYLYAFLSWLLLINCTFLIFKHVACRSGWFSLLNKVPFYDHAIIILLFWWPCHNYSDVPLFCKWASWGLYFITPNMPRDQHSVRESSVNINTVPCLKCTHCTLIHLNFDSPNGNIVDFYY